MISRDKFKTISTGEAEALTKEIHAAPMLNLDECDRDIMVKRVGLLPGPARRLGPPGMGGDSIPFLQTPTGGYMRLPDGLAAWAYDLVAMSLAMGNPFPCLVSFGRHGDGSYWAELQ